MWKIRVTMLQRKGKKKGKNIFIRGQQQAHGIIIIITVFILKIFIHLAGICGLNTTVPLLGDDSN